MLRESRGVGCKFGLRQLLWVFCENIPALFMQYRSNKIIYETKHSYFIDFPYILFC